jgi:hypothetical protein
MIVPAPVLTSYLDESSDEKQQQVLCVAACCATDTNWLQIQRYWAARLAKDGVQYFRASSCKAVSGPFFHLRRTHGSFAAARVVADKIRADLEDSLLAFPWAGFMLGVILPDYKEILDTLPEARAFFVKDPIEHAYSQIMYEVTRTVRKKAGGRAAAFVIDQSVYSPKIIAAYNAMRGNHPTIAKSSKTISPLDDKTTGPLQVADLIASVAKDMFLDWLSRPKDRYAPLPAKWQNHIERIGTWDKAHFLRALIKTLESPRLVKGTLARRPRPERKLSKSARKKIRKELIAQLAKDKHGKSV